MGNIYVTLNDQITNKIEWYDQYENQKKKIYIYIYIYKIKIKILNVRNQNKNNPKLKIGKCTLV